MLRRLFTFSSSGMLQMSRLRSRKWFRAVDGERRKKFLTRLQASSCNCLFQSHSKR
jgi:hypothetical protein